MVKYKEVRVKLTNNQLNKSKSAAKKKTGTTWTNKINFQDEEFPHKLFLMIRQKTRKDAFANNMSTSIKFSKLNLLK